MDLDDEPESPKNEKEVAGGETEKPMPQKTKGKEETYEIV